MEPAASVKDFIKRALADIPDDATLEEAIDRICLIYEIEEGNRAVEKGQTMSTEEVKRSLARWLK